MKRQTGRTAKKSSDRGLASAQLCGEASFESGTPQRATPPLDAPDASLAAAKRIEELELKLAALEQKLKHDAEHLCHADRLMTLGTLSAGVVHELKNPLGAVSGFCQLGRQMLAALRPASGNAEERDEMSGLSMCLDEITKNVDIMQSILENLRSFSRKDAGTTGRIDLIATIADAIKILSFRMHNGANVVLLPGPESFYINGNANQLVQVWTNILGNAFDAIAEREERDLAFTGNGRVEAVVYPCERGVVVEIRDNGIGMPPDVRDKLFTPFFTTKKEFAGTGLGLSIVAQILREHGAGIEVESEPGKGTLFRIRFTAAE
ncbi:MAG: HAMP domain-containing sensor histidine kinase [Candidatus Brocadiia bacterium]